MNDIRVGKFKRDTKQRHGILEQHREDRRLLPPGLQPWQAANLAPGGMECVGLKAARKDQERDGRN